MASAPGVDPERPDEAVDLGVKRGDHKVVLLDQTNLVDQPDQTDPEYGVV